MKQILFLFIFVIIAPLAGFSAGHKEMQDHLDRQRKLAQQRGPLSDHPPRGDEPATRDSVLDSPDFRNAHLTLLREKKRSRDNRTPQNNARLNAAWSVVSEPKRKAMEELEKIRNTIKQLNRKLTPLDHFALTGQTGKWFNSQWVVSPTPPTTEKINQMLTQRLEIKAHLQQASQEAALAENKLNQAVYAIRQGEWQAQEDENRYSLQQETAELEAEYARRTIESGISDRPDREVLKTKIEFGREIQPSSVDRFSDWIESQRKQ